MPDNDSLRSAMAPIDIDHPEGFRTLTRQDVWWDSASFVVVGYDDRGVCIKSLCVPVSRWKLWLARLRHVPRFTD
jgi:hypothetical protein